MEVGDGGSKDNDINVDGGDHDDHHTCQGYCQIQRVFLFKESYLQIIFSCFENECKSF